MFSFFLQHKLIILALILASVLAEPDQDEANSHFFEGFFLGNILGYQNQIGKSKIQFKNPSLDGNQLKVN